MIEEEHVNNIINGRISGKYKRAPAALTFHSEDEDQGKAYGKGTAMECGLDCTMRKRII